MTTLERVRKIIVRQLGVDAAEVSDEAKLADDLGADSLDAVEIAMALETEFVIDIPDEDANDAKTVGDLVKLVDSKAQAQA